MKTYYFVLAADRQKTGSRIRRYDCRAAVGQHEAAADAIFAFAEVVGAGWLVSASSMTRQQYDEAVGYAEREQMMLIRGIVE